MGARARTLHDRFGLSNLGSCESVPVRQAGRWRSASTIRGGQLIQENCGQLEVSKKAGWIRLSLFIIPPARQDSNITSVPFTVMFSAASGWVAGPFTTDPSFALNAEKWQG